MKKLKIVSIIVLVLFFSYCSNNSNLEKIEQSEYENLEYQNQFLGAEIEHISNNCLELFSNDPRKYNAYYHLIYKVLEKKKTILSYYQKA